MAQAPAGWTPVAEPSGWTPVAAPPADTPVYKQSDTSPNAVDWIDRLVQWIPAAAGTAGGVVGGIGGTVAGMGVGGAPGAIMGAALGGAAGEAYKELINRARGHVAAPATSGAAAKAIGVSGAVQGGAEAVGQAATPLLSALGSRMMQSAAKPGSKLLVRSVKAGEETPRVVQTLLDEGINVTPGGVAKLQTLLKSTNQDIADALAPATATISPYRVAARLGDTAKKFATQVNPQADLAAIADVGNNFIENRVAEGVPLTVQAAQALKQGTYARIGEKYGQVGAASIEAEKALARGLKEEIAAEVPAVASLNAREGRLLEALDVVGKRVALAGNRDPVGFAWVAHNPTTFLAALIDRSPAVKSLLARGIYNGAGTAAKVSPALIRVAVQSLTTGDPEGALAKSTDRGRQ